MKVTADCLKVGFHAQNVQTQPNNMAHHNLSVWYFRQDLLQNYAGHKYWLP